VTWLSLLAAAALMSSAGVEHDPRIGYLTAAPVPHMLGLATLGGRDAVVLGSGCESAVPGVRVIQDEGSGAPQLRVVDPVQGLLDDVCTVVFRQHMSDVPCATNPAGWCDVAFS